MRYVVKINFETVVPYVLFETVDLQEAFNFFKSTFDELNEIELAKYDDDNQLLDWSNEELDQINWRRGTWVTK